jgi:hypothetical protein
MSQVNEPKRHIRTCKAVESFTEECTVVLADVSNSNVPKEKRKEEAKQTLYLKRI